MRALERLADDLDDAGKDWPRIEATFRSYLRSDFLDLHFGEVLGAFSRNFDHVVRGCTSSTSMALIDNARFEYSVRIIHPMASRPHSVKWTGMRQVVGLKGNAAAAVRQIRVPEQFKIDAFEAGVTAEVLGVHHLGTPSVISTRDVHEILDVDAVSALMVAEVLLVKQDRGRLAWTFDAGLRSIYAEESSLDVSRFRNVLDLAVASNTTVPDQVYDVALGSNNAQLAMVALESMLACGHPRAFEELQTAIESPSAAVSSGAQSLFDAVLDGRGI